MSRITRFLSIIAPLLKEPQFLPHYALFSMFKPSTLRTKLPWWTYRAIQFMDGLVPGRIVLEMGGGGSTLRYSPLASHYTVFEDDSVWREMLKTRVGHRVSFISPETKIESALECDQIKDFKWGEIDVLIIDQKERIPLDRVAVFKHAVPQLKLGAIVLLDDIHRYRDHLDAHGLESLYDNTGMAPGGRLPHSTAIYRKVSLD